MKKVEPIVAPKRIREAIKHTVILISILNEMIEKDRFYPSYLKQVLSKLSVLKEFLTKEEEEILMELLNRVSE